MRLAAAARRDPVASGWIRFPYYHHVFDDERAGFARQLSFFRNSGEFITLDQAVALLAAPEPIPGRFFSVSFDDGFRNNHTNAVPLLVEHEAVGTFFVSTLRIRETRDADGPPVPHSSETEPEYLTWAECREMQSAGMTIGSHTVTHARLSELSDGAVESELRASKASIESELGTPCLHFACPWGRPGIDFTHTREPAIAARLGYASFLTTKRGSVTRRTSPLMIERDQLLANWPGHQLRYFFSR